MGERAYSEHESRRRKKVELQSTDEEGEMMKK